MPQWELPPLSAFVPDIVSPHPNSWVTFIASMFRVMAYIILAPIILLTLVDVAAYAVARTLGSNLDADLQTGSTDIHKTKEAPMASPPPPILQVDSDRAPQEQDQRAQVPPHLDVPASPPKFAADLRFTTPGEANYELSGLFSPPISRAGSPGISLSSRRMRSSSTSLSAAGSDSEGTGGEGRLGVRPGLGMTPVDSSSLRAPEGNVTRRRAARSSSGS